MPKTIQNFAQGSLIRPVLVNCGRAGAANLDVIQEVEYVKQEAKMVYLLECLQKTPPPCIVFSDNKNEVDDIQEYLLLKGVEAVAIHGSKTQDEREYAIKSFKSGAKDVMVASGVASKGLDFNEIQHVIVRRRSLSSSFALADNVLRPFPPRRTTRCRRRLRTMSIRSVVRVGVARRVSRRRSST
jgi:ATP-dependent RNA helicase DDX41